MVNPTITYIGLIVLAIASLIATYFKIIPIEVFTTILGAILGHAVTAIGVIQGERKSLPS
jgi:hypothetical protein